MSNEFQIPARPWGDAEIKTLKANAHLLDDETRAELGLGPAPVAESTPSEDDGNIDPATITPEEVQAGVEAFNELSPEDQEKVKADAAAAGASLPTDAEGAVVDNIDAKTA